MARGDPPTGRVEWIGDDDGSAPPSLPRRRLSWLVLLLVLVVAVEVLIVLVNHEHDRSAVVRPGPRPPSAVAAPATTRANPPPTATTLIDMGRPLLAETTGWELFARGPGVVVRIAPATGRVTETPVPALATDGPVSFVVSGDAALVRPLDAVPGYVVPDGAPARRLGVAFGRRGPMLPGPGPGQVWTLAPGEHPTALRLTSVSDGTTGAEIPVPFGTSLASIHPDGSGNVLFTGFSGVYDARPGRIVRIASTELLAVGPTGWVATGCDVPGPCTTLLVDRATGVRRPLALPVDAAVPLGAVSPDGSRAALCTVGATGTHLTLLDLVSGRQRALDVTVDTAGDQRVAWSPDGRWLFAVTADGRLAVVDAGTGRVGDLGVQLPGLAQLAVRPAPS